MKSKKIEKIVKRIVTSIRNEEQKERSDMMVKSTIEEPSMDYMFTESDDQCKKRIRNLVPRLLSLRDQIEFNLFERRMTLGSRYEQKYSTKNSNKNTYFHIEILKDSGFILNCNERKIFMKDTSLFDDIKPKVKEIFDKINQENFNELYNIVMVDNGLSRESNLDEILNAF
jgi:hypothetical protein